MTGQSACQALENIDGKCFSRIVVYKDDMVQAVVPKSAKPFNFQEAYKLSDKMVRMRIFITMHF